MAGDLCYHMEPELRRVSFVLYSFELFVKNV